MVSAKPRTRLATLYHFPSCRAPEFLDIIIWLWPLYGTLLRCLHPTSVRR